MQEITVYDINNNSLINLVQWDKNVKIFVKETEIDKAYNVHFFNKNNNDAMVVKSTYQNNVLSALIPNDILTEPYPITGYIYIDKNNEQKSIYCFRISVKKRPKPSDYIYSDQKEFITFEQVLEEAKAYADNSKTSADNASQSEQNANLAKEAANELKNIATQKAEDAANSAQQALQSKTNASKSEANALESSNNSEEYAMQSKSYAKGTGGIVRPNDDSDCAEYYYNQILSISQGIKGIIPMGTITFVELSLPENQHEGFMFDISDAFISDERFKNGSGISYGAGNNVIFTANGKWDVLASSDVSGVKGDKEIAYRQGFVNITPENIGAVPENGDISNNVVVFEASENQNNVESGEKLSVILGKIKTIFTNLKNIAFTANYNDLKNRPTKVSDFENDSGYKSSWRGIQNNLESNSTEDSLSANQGKILNDTKVSKTNIINNLLATISGFALDATQGKILDDKITELNGKSYADGYVFVEFGAVPNKNTKEVIVNGVPSSAKHVWIDAAWAKKTTTGMVIPLPYVDVSNVSNGIRTAMISGKVQISTNADWTNYNAWFIVAYKL